MTNKQSWADYEIIMHHLLTDEQFGSLDPWMRNFIRQLLTSKSEQMEREKEEDPSLDELKTHPENCTCHIRRNGFNAGISACIKILKWRKRNPNYWKDRKITP
jgi:hypothetical protein